MTRIVCGIGTGPDAPSVASRADRLARDLDCELLLVHAYDEYLLLPDSERATRKRARREAEEHGSKIFERIRSEVDFGAEPEYLVAVGAPAKVLSTVATSENAGLIVVGAGGRGPAASLRRGMVLEKVLTEAPCPVVVVPPADRAGTVTERHSTVVCGIDGSERSVAAARLGADLAMRLGRRPLMVHVCRDTRPRWAPVPDPLAVWPLARGRLGRRAASQALEQALAAVPAATAVRPATGHPALALESVAEREKAQLLVIAARRREGLQKIWLGSVSRKLLRTARRPIVLLPEGVGVLPGTRHYEVRLAA